MMMAQKKKRKKHKSWVIFDDGKLVVYFRFTLYQFNPTFWGIIIINDNHYYKWENIISKSLYFHFVQRKLFESYYNYTSFQKSLEYLVRLSYYGTEFTLILQQNNIMLN